MSEISTKSIELSEIDLKGKRVDTLKVDTASLGTFVRYELLKQAIVMHHANQKSGTASTKGRSQISGSGKKLFRQKGTGFARVGNSRTNKRVGGGVAFAKKSRDVSKRMPKKQRKMAKNSAVLSKLLDGDLIVLDKLSIDKPRTREIADMLSALKVAGKSCLLSVGEYDVNLYKSARNVPRVNVLPLAQLNAGQICNHSKLIFTRDAFVNLLNDNLN